MSFQPPAHRLFVPLKSSPFAAFLDGSKTWELRKRHPRWTRTHVFVGRRVELRCGYRVGKSLWGQIVAVDDASSVDQMFARIGYKPFVPRAASSAQALRIAEETMGSADQPVIAFQVALDMRPGTCQR